MKTQVFKLSQEQIHQLEAIIETIHSSSVRTDIKPLTLIAVGLNFDDNTFTVTDENLDFLINKLNEMSETDLTAENILLEFIKQDDHNVVKVYVTDAIQEPII